MSSEGSYTRAVTLYPPPLNPGDSCSSVPELDTTDSESELSLTSTAPYSVSPPFSDFEAFDGSVSRTLIEDDMVDYNTWFPSTQSDDCSWSAAATITMGGAGLSGLPPGETVLSLSGDDDYSGSMGGGGSAYSWGRAVVGSASAWLGAVWVDATWDAYWGYHLSYSVPSGCETEPETGSVQLNAYDTPGGTLLYAVEMLFDGSTQCDGCIPVTLDGVADTPICTGWDY